MNTVDKLARDVKVGDIMWGGAYWWKISSMELVGLYVEFGLTWSGMGTEPMPYPGKYTCSSECPIAVVVVIPRTCAPCYDSDCDCIYDGVG